MWSDDQQVDRRGSSLIEESHDYRTNPHDSDRDCFPPHVVQFLNLSRRNRGPR